MKPRYWLGAVPDKDDFGVPITDVFVDGKTSMGPWAIMSVASMAKYGLGCGPGLGQRYIKLDGRWLKVEG